MMYKPGLGVAGKLKKRKVRLMSKLFSTVVVLFFALSLASVAVAYKDTGTFRGHVVAIDKYAGTLTVRSSGADSKVSPPASWPYAGSRSEYGKEDAFTGPYKSAGEFTFGIDDKTRVMMCNLSRDFRDISVGDGVNLNYRDKNGKF